ncbi:MAG: hypothetical protein Q8M26_11085 [Pseudolabrys sp.]|nr:hypothetical protein [Pseudolabrys sp.]
MTNFVGSKQVGAQIYRAKYFAHLGLPRKYESRMDTIFLKLGVMEVGATGTSGVVAVAVLVTAYMVLRLRKTDAK